MMCRCIALLSMMLLVAGCQATVADNSSGRPISISPVTKPGSAMAITSTQPAATDPEEIAQAPRAKAAFETIAATMGRAGVYRSAMVYLVAVPREDLNVIIEGIPVPAAAGLESRFHFYWCACGKACVVGEFCVLDYEVNDVIDELRAAKLEVASISPMVLHARQKPQLIRFHGEGKAEQLAKGIRDSLRWTGPDRMAPGK